jgi:prepilin-type N-terminal cleavage/methylation domain-containing protein
VIRAASRTESGFSLIEVMIAMAILGIGLMSIAVAQVTAVKMQSRSKNLQQAMFLARERMDEIDALPGFPASTFLTTPATTPDPANPIQVGNDPADATRYTRDVQVVPNTPGVGLSQVTVTVSWSTPGSTGVNQAKLSAVKRIN